MQLPGRIGEDDPGFSESSEGKLFSSDIGLRIRGPAVGSGFMCTLSWMTGDRFRCLLFNRDERRQRVLEEPPRLFSPAEGQPRYLAPIDPQGGGTWIAVNEYGISAALLNDYDCPAPPHSGEAAAPPTSRGTLPVLAMAHTDWEAAAATLAEVVTAKIFEPFHLVVQGPDGMGERMHWDRASLTRRPLSETPPPLTTSSWNSPEVRDYRLKLFQQTVSSPPRLHELLAFHSHFADGQPEYGPAMARENTSTRSLALLRVGAADVSLRHQRFDPESGTFEAPTEIRVQRRFAR